MRQINTLTWRGTEYAIQLNTRQAWWPSLLQDHLVGSQFAISSRRLILQDNLVESCRIILQDASCRSLSANFIRLLCLVPLGAVESTASSVTNFDNSIISKIENKLQFKVFNRPQSEWVWTSDRISSKYVWCTVSGARYHLIVSATLQFSIWKLPSW